MNEPRVSVVMPAHNMDPRLMLNSLAALRIPLQLIVVDDFSDDDTLQKVEAWSRTENFPVEIIRNQKRLYSYGSRLAGMKQATCPVVWNIDADDRIPSPNGVARALGQTEAEKADIFHCRAVGIRGSDPLYKSLPWAEAIAPRLSGSDIIDQFMRQSYPPAILWNKFYSRELCQKITAHAPDLEVKYFDVKFIGLLALLLAKSYVAANDLIYEYRMREIRPVWLYARQVFSLILLRTSMSPLVEALAPQSHAAFLDYCRRRLVIQTGHLSIMAEAELESLDEDQALEWLNRETLANIELTDLYSALSLSLAANAKKIRKMLATLHGEFTPLLYKRKVRNFSALAMEWLQGGKGPGINRELFATAMLFKKDGDTIPDFLNIIGLLLANARLASTISGILAPGIDITKKAN